MIHSTLGECPDPHKIEFAKYSADQYMVGTTAVYECKTGYKRKRGASSRIKCQNRIGYAQWQTELDMCIVYPPLPSQQPATQKWKVTSSSPQATTQRVMKDFCGAPISPKYATHVSMKYYMGQKLNYMCNDGYQARLPISEVSTCMNLSGRLVWSTLTLSCKNDSSVAEDATTQLLATGWLSLSLYSAISIIATVIIL